MIITIVGSCANQISNREGVSLLIENKQSNILIDCGPGVVAALGRAGRRASDINNVLLTHVHGDHIAGFPYFVWNRNFERLGSAPASDLDVYGQEDVIEYAKYTLQHCYPEITFPFKINFHLIESNDNFNCGNKLDVSVFSANHTVPCISCVIKSEGKKVTYSSDTLYNDKLVEVSNDADLLIHEGMMSCEMQALANKVKHSMACDAGKFATLTRAKQLVLVHIAPNMIGKEAILLSEARNNYKGSISVPHDGSVYII